MSVDIREKLKEEMTLREMPSNHRSLFESKLRNELHGGAGAQIRFLSIAASVMILFGLGYFVSQDQSRIERPEQELTGVQVDLEEFSPELKKIENYYMTAINLELASLEVTETNRGVLDEYLRKLNGLTREYQLLTRQLNLDEIDEELINDLIDNLQMRLQLMVELKNELKKIKSVNHEKGTI
jgi:hypothetical protein